MFKIVKGSLIAKSSVRCCKNINFYSTLKQIRSFGTSVNDVMPLGKTYNPGKYWVTQSGIPVVNGIVIANKSMKEPILTQINKKVAVIAFNKPEVLNAFDLEMSKTLYKKMLEFERNPNLNCVVQIGAGDKSFSTGGNMKTIYNLLKNENNTKKILEFFSNEYILDNQIANSDIPVVSILNGLTMGGATGISLHNNYSIVTPNTVFSVPEVKLGFFPDSGSSHFLARLPRGFGFYLALTGASVSGAELIHVGLSKYYINTQDINLLMDRLSLLDTRSSDGLHKILSSVCIMPESPSSEFLELINNVNTIFGPCCQLTDTIEQLLNRLKSMNNDWSNAIYNNIMNSSALSIKITWKSLRDSIYKSLSDVLINDYRLTSHFLDSKYSNNLLEGINSMLINKDQKPKFEQTKLSQVQETTIQTFFSSLSNKMELVFPPKQNLSSFPELKGNYMRRNYKPISRDYLTSSDLTDILLRNEDLYKKETFTHPITGEEYTVPMNWEDEQNRNYRKYEIDKEIKRDIQRDSKIHAETTEEDEKLKDIKIDY